MRFWLLIRSLLMERVRLQKDAGHALFLDSGRALRCKSSLRRTRPLMNGFSVWTQTSAYPKSFAIQSKTFFILMKKSWLTDTELRAALFTWDVGFAAEAGI